MKRRLFSLLALATMVALVAGCGQNKAADSVDPGLGKPPSTDILATEPLWPRFGLQLSDGKAWIPAMRFRSFRQGEAELVPVAIGTDTLLLSRKNDAVYLYGRQTAHGAFDMQAEPTLLYKLPIRQGDQWQVENLTCKADGTEQLPTPGGTQQSVRVICTAIGGGEDHREFWVPGYGLVRLEYSNAKEPFAATAAKEINAPEAPPVGHPAPGTSTLLLEKNGRIWATAGGPMMFEQQIGREPSEWHWLTQPGGADLLLGLYLGQPGTLRAYGYNHGTGKLDEFTWTSDRGVVSAAVVSSWSPGTGELKIRDATVYPVRTDIYRFNGTTMLADPSSKNLQRAATAREFVQRLFGAPALARDNFASLFAIRDDGDNLWQLMRGLAPGSQLSADIQDLAAPSDKDPAAAPSFLVVLGEKRQKVQVQVTRGKEDWHVTAVGYPQ